MACCKCDCNNKSRIPPPPPKPTRGRTGLINNEPDKAIGSFLLGLTIGAVFGFLITVTLIVLIP